MRISIPLTQGFEAVIDASDEPTISRYKWHVQKTTNGPVYASGHVGGKRVLLHRFLLGAVTGTVVRHLDGNGLHNWRDNLLLVTTHYNPETGGGDGKGIRLRPAPKLAVGIIFDQILKMWAVYIPLTAGFRDLVGYTSTR